MSSPVKRKWKIPALFLRFKFILLLLIVCTSVVLISLTHGDFAKEEESVFRVIVDSTITEFLVNTPGCQIPSLDPWDKSINDIYERTQRYQCPGRPSFLRVLPNGVVSLDDTYLQFYYEVERDDVACTYQPIYRSGSVADFTMDSKFELGSSRKLEFDVPLNEDFMKTTCAFQSSQSGDTLVFTEYLALTPLKSKVEEACQKKASLVQKKEKLLNVLFVGIDSVSRLNFIRHFPRSNKFINDNLSPYTLKGYTKVGDNTFPNLVPMLTGRFYEYYWNETTNRTMYFDDVDFIWKEFAKRGYRTFLAEDAPEIATFNYYRSGFKVPPTDYYFRPFALSVEKTDYRSGNCVGNKLEMEVVYNYLKSFLSTMNNTRPFFAFTFVARLTHDVFNYAGYADEPTYQLLKYLHDSEILDNTALVFFSDHGIRFGPIRKTYIGQVEERMPFVHLILPKWFREKYKKQVQFLAINQNRLTTPFDIHFTIRDLLNITFSDVTQKVSLESSGISLFKEVPIHRTCEHALISPHYCMCQIQQDTPLDNPVITSAADVIVDTLNRWMVPVKDNCVILTLKHIYSARLRRALNVTDDDKEWSRDTTNIAKITGKVAEYLILVSTIPGNGLFEATVRCTKSLKCLVVDDISRINRYASQSYCIDNTNLKKYCYCK